MQQLTLLCFQEVVAFLLEYKAVEIFTGIISQSKAPRATVSILFHSVVMFVLSFGYAILTIRITEAFSLPKLSLFSNYKVMMFLCHLRVN